MYEIKFFKSIGNEVPDYRTHCFNKFSDLKFKIKYFGEMYGAKYYTVISTIWGIELIEIGVIND